MRRFLVSSSPERTASGPRRLDSSPSPPTRGSAPPRTSLSSVEAMGEYKWKALSGDTAARARPPPSARRRGPCLMWMSGALLCCLAGLFLLFNCAMPGKAGCWGRARSNSGRNMRGLDRVDPYLATKLGAEGARICQRGRYPAAERLLVDKVTFLVNGFSESRIPLMQRNLKVFALSPVVHSIVVLWANSATPRALLEDDPAWQVSLGGGGAPPPSGAMSAPAGPAPILIVRQPTSSLNDRFLPREIVRTRAVVICDDDITVDVEDLEFAHRVWRQNQHRIVGFFSRAHFWSEEDGGWVYKRLPDRYSIMLTKFMLLHTDYLFEYSCFTPRGVKEFVDSGTNCEDIAMNFVVSQRTLQGPLLVGGTTRDWGDGRNSEKDMAAVGLSARETHKASRDSCLREFHSLWGAMELRYSYSMMVRNISQELVCDRFGVLVDCRATVRNARQARHALDLHVIHEKKLFAYVTHIPSPDLVPAAIALAQSIRLTGSMFFLVLLVDKAASPTINVSDPVLLAHFDVVRTVKNHFGIQGFGMLNAWRLPYSKVVYLDVDTLVLGNLDHLFSIPEPAAAPDVFMSAMFNPGLFVLQPSPDTFKEMRKKKMGALSLHSTSLKAFLNAFYSGWFDMPREHRLPARYNAILLFSKDDHPPPWYDVDKAFEVLGPIQMVHFANPRFWPWRLEQALNYTREFLGEGGVGTLAWTPDVEWVDSAREGGNGTLLLPPVAPDPINVWSLLWLRLVERLHGNEWMPLDPANFSLTALLPDAADYISHDLGLVAAEHTPLEPPELSPAPKNREAFVTLITRNNFFSAAVWATSYQQHHPFDTEQSRRTILLVLSSVPEADWRPYKHLFNFVKVVHPIEVAGKQLDDTFSILHAWGQEGFQKLVYVDASALFVDNCYDLLLYHPFAAVSSVFPPDQLSSRVMVIQPFMLTFADMLNKLKTLHYRADSVDSFLNAYFNSWFSESPLHRIPPNYAVDGWMRDTLKKTFSPWKVLLLDSSMADGNETSAPSSVGLNELDVMSSWRDKFCSLDVIKKLPQLKFICNLSFK